MGESYRGFKFLYGRGAFAWKDDSSAGLVLNPEYLCKSTEYGSEAEKIIFFLW